ncbi:hypothetical protein BST13_31100 [Mycobacterium aquaticum]|uniref:Glycosyltransferase 2-like domain-containing protein n=1 Tax=Mycobacterium aquaticum TaxID=1927124 RepID=A0A1X0AAH6_9MYCO|nr:hypothetical protein BST13_31100 [Mycobacterium aquaticum]
MCLAPRTDPTRVAVCIATYRRSQGLRRLLRSLNELSFPHSRMLKIEIVVVDNDPAGSARSLCADAAAWVKWPLHYLHEPRRGISQVRNCAVAFSRTVAEFTAFIDDDEVATTNWLDELLYVQAAYDADAVLGPAVRIFEGPAPEWATRGKYFEGQRHSTGDLIEHGGIGNALINNRVFTDAQAPFDERLGLSGGEDTLFFLRLARLNRKLVWADDAVIHEFVPCDRTRVRWVLKRVYRTANTWSFCERELQPSTRTLAVRAAKGLVRVGMGLLMLPLGLLLGRHVLVRALWYVSYGLGNLTGLLGLRYDAYRNAGPR